MRTLFNDSMLEHQERQVSSKHDRGTKKHIQLDVCVCLSHHQGTSVDFCCDEPLSPPIRQPPRQLPFDPAAETLEDWVFQAASVEADDKDG